MRRAHAYRISRFIWRIISLIKGNLFILAFLLSFLPSISSFSQDYPAYDEIALFVDVPNLGGRDMDMLIQGNEVYLPITDLFDFLMIRNIPSANMDTIIGFFINQDAKYLIDRKNYQISYANQLFELNPEDLIRTETNLYLRGFYFGHIFGLDSRFNFRTMSVRIDPRMELPAIRDMKLEALRKNMKRLVGEEEADTTIGRNYPFFQFGMADWSANVTEQIDGRVDSRLSLAMGSMLAGGEATVVLNYNSFTPFTEKQQHYLWRFVKNENRAVRQVMLGKIVTGATSSIFDPVVGAKVTNTSTKFRRSFGTYTLSDRTEPEWIVELYVNNVLVDFTTADASGFFTFDVPLVYGNTSVRLKFYGPYGEERVREQNITIPFNFVPKKTFEYSVSAGMVEDGLQSKFSRASAFYGLTKSITLGTGVEYLSTVSSGPVMPYINGSFRLARNLLLSGEFSPQVRSKGTLTYRLPSSLQFDLDYVYYTKGQTAIFYKYREERKFSMSMPVRLKNFSVYNRFSIHQLVLPTTNYTTSEWLISGALYGVSTNITTYGVFIGNTKPFFYSDFSFAFRLPASISIQPRVQYSYTNKEFLSAKILAEKRVFKKGYFTASYEHNFRSDMYLVEVGFRYNLKFAQTGIGVRHTNRTTTFIQNARGSIVNDNKNNYVHTDNIGNVGKGALCIIPFLDKNANGVRDEGEPKVYGLNFRANSGRIVKREKDTTIRIFGLEPYTDCFIEFEQSSLENIAWRLKERSMNIAVDPNIVKVIDVPINIVGEAAGMVRLDNNDVVQGIARIIVNVYNKDQQKIGRVLTESNGYFSYFGLYPGAYFAQIDSAQMRKLGMLSSPDSINFDIDALIDGDYVDGLDFMIKYKEVVQPISMIVHEELEQVLDTDMNSYTIEVGSFENETEAIALRDQMSMLLGKEVSLFKEDGLYKVQVSGLNTKDEVIETFPVLQSNGISEIGLITFKGMLSPTATVSIPGIETISSETGAAVVITNEKIVGDTTSTNDTYAIEVAAFENEAEADELRDQLTTILGKEVSILPENGLYKVLVTGLTTKDEVKETFPALQSKGINEIGLITHKGMIEPMLVSIVLGAEVDTIKSFTESDTAVLVIHKIISKDATLSTDSYVVEIGAFENETEAIALRDQMSMLLGKEVSLFKEDGLYKVQVSGLSTKDEVIETFPVLQSNGISEIGLITFKGMSSPAPTANIQGIETTPIEIGAAVVIAHENINEDITTSSDSYVIEVGAFKNEAEAKALRDQLSTVLGKEVSLFPEDDLYKVRVTGIETVAEVEETFPVLQSNGINQIGLITFKGMLSTAETTQIPDETFTDIIITDEKIKEDTTSATDSYVVEVGAFKNESEAFALRDQLSTLLGKEVSLFPEDNLYKVRVTGLDSMDEVEEAFPVLIDKGINEIGLITFKGISKPAQTTNISGIETDPAKTLSNQDNTVVVAHEKIKEDTTSSTDSYVIEVGAFTNESEANALRDQLSILLGKEVSLFPENDLYKVRVTGLQSEVEIEQTNTLLQSIGINQIGLITFKGMLKPTQETNIAGIETDPDKTFIEKDISGVVIHEIVIEDNTSATDSYAIQLGAFKQKENAYKFKKQLTESLGEEVTITVEGEFYKVRLSGFKSSYEIERYIPTLVEHGIREIWVVTLKGTLKPDIIAGESDINREVLNTMKAKDTTYLIIHDVFEEVLTTGLDSYAIQFGAFNRKINADALRVKLTAILGKDVEIFIEDNLYNVRMIDFETRDEVEAYLPELYKNGISEMKVLPLKGKQNYRTVISRLDTISEEAYKSNFKDTYKEQSKEVKKSTPDNSIMVKKPATPEKKKEEIPMIPVEERAVEKTKVKETISEVSKIEEPKKEIVEVPYEVERKKTLEERLLVAEYRSGLYESRWPGVEFTIQIAASRSISDPEDIKKKFGLSGNVEVVQKGEWYRFTTGSYIKFWQAREYRNILRTRIGIEDAFVVAYKDGKRIMLTDLVAMTESTPDASTGITVRPEISKGFSIQILATKDGNISVTEIRNKYQVDEDIFKEYNEIDGLFRYSIGNFSTYTGAVKVRNKIRAKGFRDAFVVGYKDGKRVKDIKSIL